MSSTIYYKGTLKDNVAVEALYEAVVESAAELNCKIVREEDTFYLEFTDGTSEPLMFKLDNRKINWFCKWNNPANPEEYFKIFDLFIAIRPLFKTLRIDDDEGAWQDYFERSRPCKINLRELSGPIEHSLLERDFTFSKYDLSDFLKPGMRFIPYSKVVYCVIAQDLLTVLDADTVEELDMDKMIELANKVQFEEMGPFSRENFAFEFPYILMLIWIGYCLTYGRRGRVCQLSNDVWGLKTNKLAAQAGILSEFLNIHSSTVNSKHTELKRFAKKYIYTGPPSECVSAEAKAQLTQVIKAYVAQNDIDTNSNEPVLIPLTGEIKEAYEAILANISTDMTDLITEDAGQSLQVLVSILDYLGFKYVGAE